MALWGDDEVDLIFNEVNEELTFVIPPVTKVTAFAGYSELITGGTFQRQFRYTNDGVTWTDFDDIANIGSVPVDSDVPYLFELKYKLTAGATPQTVQEFYVDLTQNLSLDHSFVEFQFENVFSNLEYSDPNFVFWCNNVRDKLEKLGIIPEFIQRNEDYTAFWESVSCFFALIYAKTQKEFVELYSNKDNLREYLTQRGMFFCGDELLTSLQLLANEFYKEIAKRGTQEVDEEVKRILCFNTTVVDWLFIIFIDKEDTGWNLNNTSPLHVGFQNVKNANMMFKKGPQVELTTDYELYNPSGLSTFAVVPFQDFEGENIDVLEIDQTGEALNAVSGVRLIESDPNWGDKKITVDHTQSYTFEFWAHVTSGDGIPEVRFGLTSTDKDDNPLQTKTFVLVPVLTNSFVIGDVQPCIGNDDQYYKFQAILYGKNLTIANLDGVTLADFYLGRNLHFDNSFGDVKYIYPFVLFEKVSGGIGTNTKVKIWDVRVAPAFAGESITQQTNIDFALGGLFTTSSLLYNFMINNGSYTDEELNKIMQRYLFPTATDFFNNYI